MNSNVVIAARPIMAKKCHEEHPVLSFGKGEFMGASCIHPRDKFDIYIGFDENMTKVDRWLPWLPQLLRRKQEILFPIRDMSVPPAKQVDNFKKLVTWTAAQLKKGKKVHAGCIGGHGRTGLFLAALIY